MFSLRIFARPFVTTSIRSYHAINYKLLNSYKSIYGNVTVPIKYKVDTSLSCFSNMEGDGGFALGYHVSTIRTYYRKGLLFGQDVNKLRDMGFVFDAREEKRRCVLLAFKTYIDKFKSTKIIRTYKIAKDDESWPKETRGIALGEVLNKIRRGQYSTIVDEVISMGINVENVNNSPYFELYFEALKVFKKINGHCKPTSVFVVPEGDVRYNEEAWGIPLGMWLMTVRCKGNFSEHRQRLVDLGVDFNIKAKVPFEIIYSTLVSYKNIYGHVNVPRMFKVPEGDDRYVMQAWGYKLGSCVMNVRNKSTFVAHREKLEALGFDFNKQKASLDFKDIYTTLVTYKNIHGDVNVPVKFKVPEGDDCYSKQAWGYKLGSCVRDMRNKGYYAEHSDRLIELGVKINKTKKTSSSVDDVVV